MPASRRGGRDAPPRGGPVDAAARVSLGPTGTATTLASARPRVQVQPPLRGAPAA